MLPNFLCVGVVKGGTTTLHHTLKEHPDVFLPAVKELYFFDSDENYRKGVHWYEGFYRKHNQESAVGEIAPTYLYPEPVAKRIYETLGKAIKLIFSLRNPVDRAYSHYVMNCMKGREKNSFEKAIGMEAARANGGSVEKARFSYLGQGFYSTQIKRYLRFFPKENMLFLIFEDDLLKNREQAFQNAFELLGVSNFDVDLDVWKYAGKPAALPKNKAVRTLSEAGCIRRLAKMRAVQPLKKLFLKQIPKKIDPDLKNHLIAKYFFREIEDLELLIGRDLSSWRS